MRRKGKKGAPLLQRVVDALLVEGSPIGDPRPLSTQARRAAEEAAGVALSPSMHALLSLDWRWIDRTCGWFDGERLRAVPVMDLVEAHAGPMADAFRPLVEQRLPALALPLDAGSDSFRLLYLGDPDERGEYPVLCLDHDEVPLLGAQHAGFDHWLASALGLEEPDTAEPTNERLFGQSDPIELFDEGEWGDPVPGPAPGTVKHPEWKPPALRWTAARLAQALLDNARDPARLQELLAHPLEFPLEPALIEASRGGDVKAVRVLLSAGADPQAEGALAHAAAHGHGEVVALLLSQGACADDPWGSGKTALHAAISRVDLPMVRQLVEAGARLSGSDEPPLYEPPLHEAVEADDAALVRALIAMGAEPVGTALHLALEEARDEVVLALLESGVDPNTRSDYLGRTALHLAFERGRDRLAPALIRSGADRSLLDERGLSLEAVYGPSGEDLRRVELRGSASKLEVRLRLAVTNPYQARAAAWPPHDPAFWVELARAGLLGPAAELSVGRKPARGKLSKAGWHELKFVLVAKELEPAVLAAMGRCMLGGPVVWTGAGVEHVLRVVHVELGTEGEPQCVTPRWPTPRGTVPITLEKGEGQLALQLHGKPRKPDLAALAPALGHWITWSMLVASGGPLALFPTADPLVFTLLSRDPPVPFAPGEPQLLLDGLALVLERSPLPIARATLRWPQPYSSTR